MYLKALQRPRRVPMRCSNEGFFNTTTNLVVSLLVNLIIFSFCVRSLLLVSCSALFLLLPITLSPRTPTTTPTLFSLLVSHLPPPSPLLPSDFLSLIPSLFQLSRALRFFLVVHQVIALSAVYAELLLFTFCAVHIPELPG